MRFILLAAIRAYQRFVSPHKGFSCAYRVHTGRASCSAFGYRAVRLHGVFAGLALIRARTRLCGVVHRQHTCRARPPLSQRGMCDLGCDLPCHGGCDVSGIDVVSGICDFASCGDCGGCDWWSRRKQERGVKYVDIPPHADLGRRRSKAVKPVKTEALQHYYSARAPEYDRIYQKPERQQDLRAIEQWLPSALAGRDTLEVACGTGYWTQFMAGSVKSLVAVDASSEVLQIAQARAKTAGVRFVLGDAYRLPMASRQFDAAFAGFWFSHVPRSRVQEFLQGLHAALKPGAKVVLLDNRYVEGSSTPVAELDADGNQYQLRKLEDGSTHRVLKNFPTERELRNALAGMASEVRFLQWQYYWALEYELK